MAKYNYVKESYLYTDMQEICSCISDLHTSFSTKNIKKISNLKFKFSFKKPKKMNFNFPDKILNLKYSINAYNTLNEFIWIYLESYTDITSEIKKYASIKYEKKIELEKKTINKKKEIKLFDKNEVNLYKNFENNFYEKYGIDFYGKYGIDLQEYLKHINEEYVCIELDEIRQNIKKLLYKSTKLTPTIDTIIEASSYINIKFKALVKEYQLNFHTEDFNIDFYINMQKKFKHKIEVMIKNKDNLKLIETEIFKTLHYLESLINSKFNTNKEIQLLNLQQLYKNKLNFISKDSSNIKLNIVTEKPTHRCLKMNSTYIEFSPLMNAEDYKKIIASLFKFNNELQEIRSLLEDKKLFGLILDLPKTSKGIKILKKTFIILSIMQHYNTNDAEEAIQYYNYFIVNSNYNKLSIKLDNADKIKLDKLLKDKKINCLSASIDYAFTKEELGIIKSTQSSKNIIISLVHSLRNCLS